MAQRAGAVVAVDAIGVVRRPAGSRLGPRAPRRSGCCAAGRRCRRSAPPRRENGSGSSASASSRRRPRKSAGSVGESRRAIRRASGRRPPCWRRRARGADAGPAPRARREVALPLDVGAAVERVLGAAGRRRIEDEVERGRQPASARGTARSASIGTTPGGRSTACAADRKRCRRVRREPARARSHVAAARDQDSSMRASPSPALPAPRVYSRDAPAHRHFAVSRRAGPLAPDTRIHYRDAAYARALAEAGDTPSAAAAGRRRALAARLDGLLIPGGGDFAPRSRLSRRSPFDLVPPRQLAFDRALLAAALERALPVLGICYGMQLLALALRRRADYDIPSDVPARPSTLGSGRAPRPRVEPAPSSRGLLGAAPARQQPAPPGGRRGRTRARRGARGRWARRGDREPGRALRHRRAVAPGA